MVQMTARLSVNSLSAYYGQAFALRNVDLWVGQAEVVGVLGRNGAGKTTLMRSIARLHTAITGEIAFDGVSLVNQAAVDAARAGITLVREGAQVPASLTVDEVLSLGSRLRKMRGHDDPGLNDVWEWFPLLAPLRDKRAGFLSGGERQALALATAFHSAPQLLMLDEPSAGLAPQVAENVFATIAQFARSGVAVLIVEQDPRWLDGLAQRSYALDLGEVRTHVPENGNL